LEWGNYWEHRSVFQRNKKTSAQVTINMRDFFRKTTIAGHDGWIVKHTSEPTDRASDSLSTLGGCWLATSVKELGMNDVASRSILFSAPFPFPDREGNE
jgi:hypothetical protein